MPLIAMKCDNGDGTINWYNRTKIIYVLLGGNKRQFRKSVDNPDMLRQLPNVVRHFKAIRKRRLAEARNDRRKTY